MTAQRWAEVDGLFQEASALPSGDRASFLEQRCPGDPELRREVESLLANAGLPDTFISRLLEGLEPVALISLAPGTCIGEYRIERLPGSGGMGSVYLASRADGEFDQQVAIKVPNSLTATDWARPSQHRT